MYRSEPGFCELNGQQVVRIRISLSVFCADIASSGFLVISVLEIMNVFNTPIRHH